MPVLQKRGAGWGERCAASRAFNGSSPTANLVSIIKEAKAFLARSALAEWPVSPRESVNVLPRGEVMSGEYQDEQTANGGRSTVLRQEITISNELGLHARPAAEFVTAAKAFRSEIWLVKGSERFSANSILEILTANLNCGETAAIEAEGPDADDAIRRLAELITEFAGREPPGNGTASRKTGEDFQ